MNRYLYLAGLALIAAVGVAIALPEGHHRSKRQDDADYAYDYEEQDETEAALGLPSDSSSIRENIIDDFSCEARPYGYYADVANECQIFHICYPVTYADGEEELFKWSFICPNGTIFDQSSLVCSFPLDALPCEEAPNFFEGPDSINSRFGLVEDADSDY